MVESILSLIETAPEKATVVLVTAFLLPLAFHKPACAEKRRLCVIRGVFATLMLWMIWIEVSKGDLKFGLILSAVFTVSIVVATATIVAVGVYQLVAWVWCLKITELWAKILGR